MEEKNTGTEQERDLTAEAMELIRERPELRGRELPEEVAKSCAEGKRLLDAYMEYEGQALTRQSIQRQNEDGAQRAPVSAVSRGGGGENRPSDPFLEGFNSEEY